MNKETEKNKNLEIENFFGAFEDASDEWDNIEKRIYSSCNKSRTRETPKFASLVHPITMKGTVFEEYFFWWALYFPYG